MLQPGLHTHSSSGDRVEITGIFRAIPRRVNPRVTTMQCLFRTYVDAIHFRKKGDERDDIVDVIKTADDTTTFGSEKTEAILDFARDGKAYDKLAASLAPSIHGLEDVKRGVLCMLFGGCSRAREVRGAAGAAPRDGQNRKDGAGGIPGARSRGDINVLMCGDPGTSKSQLLGYVHKIAPRGVYTSGKGSSAVGLTASVQRDPETKELVMESGAVVLSDLGVCCIDEFDKMSDATRAVLHEAMEQQTISLAKAGIVATLNARASIFASANPVDSRYNPKLSVVENIQLPPTLLSRFDLIYLILDNPDKDKDRRLAKHIVALYAEDADDRPRAHAVDERFVRDYISYARAKVHPELSDEARDELVDAYVRMRGGGSSRPNRGRSITATPRQLEAAWKSTSELGGPDQTSGLSSSAKSMSIRLIFGRIDRSRRVLEAEPKSTARALKSG